MLKESHKHVFPHFECNRHTTCSQKASTAPETNPAPESEHHSMSPSYAPLPHREITNNFESPRFKFITAVLTLCEARLILDVGHN